MFNFVDEKKLTESEDCRHNSNLKIVKSRKKPMLRTFRNSDTFKFLMREYEIVFYCDILRLRA